MNFHSSALSLRSHCLRSSPTRQPSVGKRFSSTEQQQRPQNKRKIHFLFSPPPFAQLSLKIHSEKCWFSLLVSVPRCFLSVFRFISIHVHSQVGEARKVAPTAYLFIVKIFVAKTAAVSARFTLESSSAGKTRCVRRPFILFVFFFSAFSRFFA